MRKNISEGHRKEGAKGGFGNRGHERKGEGLDARAEGLSASRRERKKERTEEAETQGTRLKVQV